MGKEIKRAEIKVLIVEDNREYALLLKAFLSMSKRAVFTCDFCESARTAAIKIADNDYDAVLTDLNLPDSAGLQTVALLSAAAPEKPIIVLSSAADERICVDVIKTGAQDFVNKGDCHENIELAVLRAIERKKYEEKLVSSREELASVIAGAPVKILIVNSEYRVILTNPAAEKLFINRAEPVRPELFGDMVACINAMSSEGSCGTSLHCAKCPVRKIIKDALEKETHAYKQEAEYTIKKEGAEEKLVLSVSTTDIKIRGGRCVMLFVEDITEEKKAAAQVIMEKERAEGYFEIAGTFLLLLDEAGNISKINKKGCEILELTGAAEALGKNWYDSFIPGEIRDGLKKMHLEGLAAESAMEKLHTNEILTKNGNKKIIEWNNRRIIDDGKIYYLSSGEDITEKTALEETRHNALKATAQQALETEELLGQAKNVITQMGDFHATARLIFDSCRKMTGAKSGYVALLSADGKENELIFLEPGGMECSVNPGLPMPVRGLWERAYDSRSTVFENDFMNSEWVKFMPSGHVVLKNVMFAPLVIEGKAVGVIGLANKKTDFTQNDARFVTQMGGLAALALHNSRIEQKLAESEAHFKSLVNNTPGIFFKCLNDPEWTMLYMSDAVVQLFGYESDDFINNNKRSYNSIIHPEDRYRVAREVSGKISSGISYSLEYRVITAQGETRWVSEKGQMVKAAGKESIEGIILDITKQKENEDEIVKAYAELRELERMKSNFVAIVSHELRTPITVIKGFSSFLLKGVAGEIKPKQKEFMETIASNSSRLEMIINDLIDVSKIEAGIMSITKNSCNISKTVSDVVKDMEIISMRKNIMLETEIADENITVSADGPRVTQVVVNLVNNAVKFSDAGSVITVGLTKPFAGSVPAEAGELKYPAEKYACLSVRDRGVGIEKEHIKKVFDRFYQIESADVRKHQGAGLGLSIAKSIVEMHGGHIWCESEGKGKGTVFYALFPEE